MRKLVILAALVSPVALAADCTPWPHDVHTSGDDPMESITMCVITAPAGGLSGRVVPRDGVAYQVSAWARSDDYDSASESMLRVDSNAPIRISKAMARLPVLQRLRVINDAAARAFEQMLTGKVVRARYTDKAGNQADVEADLCGFAAAVDACKLDLAK